MKKLTYSDLIRRVVSHNGAAIIGLETLTDAKAAKTGNPFPEKMVFKHVRCVGFVGANYGKAVQREGERQGSELASEFVARPLPWGHWHAGAEGKIIRTQSTPGQRARQAAKVLSYRDVNGQFLSKDAVLPFLPVRAVSARQAAVGVGSDDAKEQIMVNTYKFSSIRKVRMNGHTFELVKD